MHELYIKREKTPNELLRLRCSTSSKAARLPSLYRNTIMSQVGSPQRHKKKKTRTEVTTKLYSSAPIALVRKGIMTSSVGAQDR